MNLSETKITLTSLEIAELTAKNHQHITRDIEAQLSEVCSLSNFGQSYKADNGQTYKMYVLPKRECLILISGYNVKLRASIIDRLQVLEDEIKEKKISVAPTTVHVNVSDPRWRKAFYLGFEGRCFFTGKPLKEDAFHLDHLVAQSRGGQDILDNLVLSSPAVNQSKSDSYSAVWSERAINDVREVFAPAVLKHYHELGENLVSKAFENSPQLANPKFIEKLEKLFGRDQVRSMYSSLLPGLNADTSIKYFNQGIGSFLDECTQEVQGSYLRIKQLYQSYSIYCEECKIAPADRQTFTDNLRENYNIRTVTKTFIVDGNDELIRAYENVKFIS